MNIKRTSAFCWLSFKDKDVLCISNTSDDILKQIDILINSVPKTFEYNIDKVQTETILLAEITFLSDHLFELTINQLPHCPILDKLNYLLHDYGYIFKGIRFCD